MTTEPPLHVHVSITETIEKPQVVTIDGKTYEVWYELPMVEDWPGHLSQQGRTADPEKAADKDKPILEEVKP